MSLNPETDGPNWKSHSLIRVAAWVCLLASLLCLAEVGLIIIKGGEWTRWVHAKNPASRLFFAVVLALAGYILRYGLRFTRRAWAQFAGRLVLAAVSTALALCAAEIGLRYYLQQTQSLQSISRLKKGGHKGIDIKSGHPLAAITQPSDDPAILYELAPDLNMDFGHTWLRTNHEGLRADRSYAAARTPHSIRIIGIGDSGMFGWGVEQNENYCAVLESNLNARADGVTYEVLNLAVPGYNTQLEVACLRGKGLPYKPDIVIVGWCDNDFSLPFFVPQEGQWTRKDVSFLYYLLFDRSRYAEIALSEVRDQRSYDQAKIPERFRQGVDEAGVQRAFTELKGLAATNHFQVLVFGSMQREAAAICRAVGLPYYNLKEKIPDDKYPEDYCVFFMHPRAPGHRVLAKVLEQELRNCGWLTVKPVEQAAQSKS